MGLCLFINDCFFEIFSFFWLLINCWFFKNNLSSSIRERRTKETLAIGTQSADGNQKNLNQKRTRFFPGFFTQWENFKNVFTLVRRLWDEIQQK